MIGLILVNLVVLWFPFLWLPYAAYLGFIVYDRNTPKRGGRTPYFRGLLVWKYVREYFPASLVESVPLDPSGRYLFAIHPHGIIGVSAIANFMNSWSGCLRGIRYRLCTLKTNFYVPFLREWLLWLGIIEVSESALDHCLSNDISAMIVIGGAAESLMAHPGQHKLVLKRRRGFVRVALKHGASLVPVFCFGENDVYEQVSNPKGSTLRRVQEVLKRCLGFTVPFFHGRGIFNYDMGIVPFRRPLTTVIGHPIELPHIPEPTKDDVMQYHEVYVEALTTLFEEWKGKLGIEDTLVII